MSPRLEHLLVSIGRQFKPPVPAAQYQRKNDFKRVLHIATVLLPVGGHSRMIRRWIESDPTRSHSIAITRRLGKISEDVTAAAKASGGEVYGQLNRRPGGIFAAVEELRSIAREHDIIVLHIGTTDVIPSIAFADTASYPPVVFLNHADHQFWVGAAISHVVGGMREAAMNLAETRRRIEKKRSVSIPILVQPTYRKFSRVAAKEALGLDPDRVAMISVARPDKYKTLHNLTYADLHAPILRKHPESTLYVVGAGDRPDWAASDMRGRIVPLPLQDPRLYMEAADIYLDSYPFCSATSMMEAASYGTPCATRFILSKEARICGMDHPGLAGPLIEALNDQEYWDKVSELIANKEMREAKGAEMLEGVKASNLPPAWCTFMEAAFARASELEPVDNQAMFPKEEVERPYLGDPDIRMNERYGSDRARIELAKAHLSSFPLPQRIENWQAVVRDGGFVGPKEAIRCLLPEWLVRILKDGVR
ncbi:MAG: glycosyl transferase family 1 [Proteobacteria bacterium]|nr:glycosyl transferase family 1 [Pseudomonadota bacterium]